MTRKDYERIAAALRSCQPATGADNNTFSDAARWQGWNNARVAIADTLATDNQRVTARVDAAVAALGALEAHELAAALHGAARAAYEAGAALQEAWQDRGAGKVWGVAGAAMERAGDRIKQEWDRT